MLSVSLYLGVTEEAYECVYEAQGLSSQHLPDKFNEADLS